jgi:lipoprotein-anchoring transpeptidase ErfK/SrfK
MDNEFNGNPYSIEVDTRNDKLRLFRNGEILREYNVSMSKQRNSAPRGKWIIIKKLPSHKQFGGYFLGLNTPYKICGIHKTSKSSITLKQKKYGSIKISSHEARELYTTVPLGTPVIIY